MFTDPLRLRQWAKRLSLAAGVFGISLLFSQQDAYSAPSPSDDTNLLARLIAAEARGEPFEGQVAVGAVVLNRVHNAAFPNTLAGVIFQPGAFEPLQSGLFWSRTPNPQEQRAAISALAGWDPTFGGLYFWDPSKVGSSWIRSRPVIRQIGHHLFAH
ncbi:MAG: cell wall hydrolase [Firmicutes bacterium]|nr:cell wall hydrolase [Bacillota bacterium]